MKVKGRPSDGDVVVPESIAIVLYLADKFPESGLMPSELALRGQAYRWLLFATTELEQPLWRIARNTFVYPEEKRLAADVPLAADDFRPMAEIVERHLDGREFVVGDRVSVVDFVMAYTLDWAEEAELLGDFPTLREYVRRMYARPRSTPRIAEALARVQQT